jgi:hypothetical protein
VVLGGARSSAVEPASGRPKWYPRTRSNYAQAGIVDRVSTRTLLVLAALTGFAILLAFAVQVMMAK